MTVGVLGGGQLGRMLGLAGLPLGLRFRFLDTDGDAPARQVGDLHVGQYDDPVALDAFAAGLDAVTFEFENVPADAVRRIARSLPVQPRAEALETVQDRLSEKRLFRSLDIPTPPFHPVTHAAEVAAALEVTGCPAVLKTRRFGYDGKGQWIVRTKADLAGIMEELPKQPDSLLLEGFVQFDREVSLIAARARSGEVVFYPLVENRHEGGILRLSLAPAPGATPALQSLAQRHVLRIMEALDYVGVLAVEFFQCGDMLLANEVAPRVHNSGHWTIEGAETSQFENHLRAILGLPLGSAAARGLSTMWNVLGAAPPAKAVLAVPGAHLHLYDKEPRSGRKIGHITVCADTPENLEESLARIRAAAPQS
jgi:5-(carboxyamino)imidazole ribonucleotide synthase